jgi:hypothetical protein
VRLDPADIEAIAKRVAELTAGQWAEPKVRYIDAAQLARILEVEPDWVYRHARQLGAIRLGGPKGRLRFDIQHVKRTLAAPPPATPTRRPGDARSCGRARRRSRPATRVDLLPYQS